MKKRILVFVGDDFKQPIGGMGVALFNIFSYAAKYSKHEYVVIIPGIKKGYKLGRNVSIETFNSGSIFPNASGMLEPYRLSPYWVLKAASLGKFDLVHAHDWSSVIAAKAYSREFGVPYIFSVHLSIQHMFSVGEIISSQMVQLYDELCKEEVLGLLEAQHIHHVSEQYRNKIHKEMEFLNSKTTILHNGIDLKKWCNLKRKKVEFPGNSKNKKIVYLGRISSQKNVINLVTARFPRNCDLIMFCGCTTSVEINSEINNISSSRNNIYMVQSIWGDMKYQIVKSADAIIFPSLHEPFGIVGLEAFAAKTPLLCSGVDGMGSYVNDNNHINCGITSSSIEEAVDNFMSLSQESLKKMTNRAYNKVKKFDWSIVAKKYFDYYDGLLV